jgi:hypothetical protein
MSPINWNTLSCSYLLQSFFCNLATERLAVGGPSNLSSQGSKTLSVPKSHWQLHKQLAEQV